MKKTIWIIVVVIVIVAIIIGVNSGEKTEGETVKIGVVLPMTGIASNYGEHQLNAIKLAVNEINQNDGVLGKKIEIILEDDNTDPKKTVTSFQKVTSVDKAPVVIGAVWDFLANSIMPIVDDKKIPTISPSAPPDSLQRTSDFFFTTFPPISIHQSVIEKYLYSEKATTVAIIYINNDWGIAHRELYKKAINSTGKNLVSTIELPKFDNNDIQREITLLKSTKPGILLVAGNVIDPKLIVEKNKELGLNARIFSHDNMVFSHVSQGINKDALKGTVVYRLAPPDTNFIKKYHTTYNKEPISEADKAYDAVYVIAKAIEISKNPSSEGIFLGLKRLTNYGGVSGPISYVDYNWPTEDTARLEIFDGKEFVPYLE